MSRYDYTNYPPVMSLALMAHLSHPKRPRKIAKFMSQSAPIKTALDQIRSDVEFAKNQSTSASEAAVMTSFSALKLLLDEIDNLKLNASLAETDKTRLDWLDAHGSDHASAKVPVWFHLLESVCTGNMPSYRAAIDAAQSTQRKQP